MTQHEAEMLATDYQQMVRTRTGLQGKNLVCPFEKSDMTPCVARDGGMATFLRQACAGAEMIASCVGCEVGVEFLIDIEKKR